MEESRGHCTPSPTALTSPHSLQTPPNLEQGVIVTESESLSPKHGQQAANMLASPCSALETPPRRSPISPGVSTGVVPQPKVYNPIGMAGMNGSIPKHCMDAYHPQTTVSLSARTPVTAPASLAYNRPLHPASPPGLPADISVNECRLIDYRGAKIAAFLVNTEYLLCLPQAFELFLKHLVGGLHTVYTKLKRLDITPIVCNVEQVRILRGLGAIQPGVNRCKLLSCKDFDALYKDCTTARPGRPPKRASMIGIHQTSAGHAALLKKSRLENDYTAYENGHITGERLEKPHSLLANGYSHHSVSTAGATSHISPIPFMALNHPSSHPNNIVPVSLPLSATSHNHSHQLNTSRADTVICKDRPTHDVIVSSRVRDERTENVDVKDRLYNMECHRVKDQYLNGNCHSPVLNLSQNSTRRGGGEHSGSETAYNDCQDDDYNDSEDDDEDDREQDYSDNPDVTSTGNSERLSSQQMFYPHVQNEGMTATGQVVSSIETLLRNIQGLLKVAADNARQQDRQISVEKAELKMEVMRERELRENLEKQLLEEQRIRILYQKRLKKEKRSRRRLQDQLESEMKKRVQYEEALRSSSAETIRLLNDSLAQELERAERNARNDTEHKVQDCPMSV